MWGLLIIRTQIRAPSTEPINKTLLVLVISGALSSPRFASWAHAV